MEIETIENDNDSVEGKEEVDCHEDSDNSNNDGDDDDEGGGGSGGGGDDDDNGDDENDDDGNGGNDAQRTMQEFLKQGDYNVIIVDWGEGNLNLYGQATANTRVVGAMIAQLITFLQVELALFWYVKNCFELYRIAFYRGITVAARWMLISNG